MYRRKPAVAGAFYPSDPEQLKGMIDRYIMEAEDIALKGEVLGVISPHAGYIYSGPVAGYSFKQLAGSDAEVVIVMAPSHRARFNGASVIPEGIYETPLGGVQIDSEIGRKLVDREDFGFIKEGHELEHSLEVQVPFLQQVLDDFRIVPIIVGTVDIDICTRLAETISDVLKNEKRKFHIVISTDLSHYHSYDEASKIDKRLVDSLEKYDENEIKNILDSKKAEACGEGPILVGMMTCKKLGAKKINILKYANSGDTAGGRDQVVGYLSAALVR